MIPEPLHDIERLAGSAGSPLAKGSQSGGLRLMARAAWMVSLAIALVFCGGFIAFVVMLENQNAPVTTKADAIVALTGGTDRIVDAVQLLADGQAKRLLITGVNRTTSPERLAQLMPKHQDLFTCCIDMDYEARNTVGNAIETRRWTSSRNFHSLIVVTSSYHMPRALLELERAMPDLLLIPHPVSFERQDGLTVTRTLVAGRVLALEYSKFIAAYARASVFPRLEAETTASILGDRLPIGKIRIDKIRRESAKSFAQEYQP